MRITKWGIHNSITINLLSIAVVASGLLCLSRMDRTRFPKFSTNIIRVQVNYDEGSTPEQVDEAVIKVIESALRSVSGIVQIRSLALPRGADMRIFVDDSRYDIDDVLEKVKETVDRIDNLPRDADRPTVEKRSYSQTSAIYLGISGATKSDAELVDIAESVKTELAESLNIDDIRYFRDPIHELKLTIPVDSLLVKGLTIESLTEQIQSNDLDVYAGTIEGSNAKILLKGGYKKQEIDALRKIPIRYGNGDVARLEHLIGPENFSLAPAEDRHVIRMNGKRAVVLRIFAGENDDLISLTEKIDAYADKKELPPGAEIHPFFNNAHVVRATLSMVGKNAVIGLLLLFVMLALFLNWKIAMWTTTGVAFSLIGAITLVYASGQNLNMMVLIGFLVASGLIVDDAIIIGERFYHRFHEGLSPVKAAIAAADELAWPITTMVSTSVAGFGALLFIPGLWGDLISAFAIAIISALLLSLMESLTILPVHLSHHSTAESRLMNAVQVCFSPLIRIADYFQPRFVACLNRVGNNILEPALRYFLKNRYAFSILFVSGIIIQYQLIRHKFIAVEAEPAIDSEHLIAEIRMMPGTSVEDTTRQAEKLVASMIRLGEDLTAENNGINPIGDYLLTSGVYDAHLAEVNVQLIRTDKGRRTTGLDFLDRWRDMSPSIPGAKSTRFYPRDRGPGGVPINIDIRSNNDEALARAESDLMQHLRNITGLIDIKSSREPGPLTARVTLHADALDAGISESQLLASIANRYQGRTVGSFYRQNNEVKIKLRTDPGGRENLAQLQSMQVTDELILSQIADIELIRTPTEIWRVNGRRTLTIEADVDRSKNINVSDIRQPLKAQFLPKLKEKYPGVEWSFGSEAEKSAQGMVYSFMIGLLIIYMILATYFRSYLEPLIVMVAILIALVGAILGHWIMGVPLSIMTGFGVVGLAGIVINDSVIIVESIKHLVKSGHSINNALVMGAKIRLLPIFLTSITLIISSCPLLFETSIEAVLLVPIIISYVFGLAFSTLMILLVIPIGYAIILDQMSLLNRILYGTSPTAEEMIGA